MPLSGLLEVIEMIEQRRVPTAEADLTPEQYEALLALKAFSGDRGLTISDLSERLQVKHHTAVGLVDKLEELRFVRRKQGVTDRRHVFVRLTAAGSRVLAKVSRFRELFKAKRSFSEVLPSEVRFGETPKPTPETGALPEKDADSVPYSLPRFYHGDGHSKFFVSTSSVPRGFRM